jgi:hypothetical protein
VRDGDDFNEIAAEYVDETEGIAGKNVAACASAVAGPRLRTRGDHADGLAQLLTKAVCG